MDYIYEKLKCLNSGFKLNMIFEGLISDLFFKFAGLKIHKSAFLTQWFVKIMRQSYDGMPQKSISYENRGAFLRLLRQLQTSKKLFQEITH
jgi:hypothetical protein